MKVLITGGAGFIGRHTVRGFLAAGAHVVVLDDFSASSPACMEEFAEETRFDLISGDAGDRGLVSELLARHKPDAVVHLAGLVSVTKSLEQPDQSWRLNVRATQVVADAAEAAGCQRFVFASSAAVYADSIALPLREADPLRPALSPYGAHKAEAEHWLMATATPAMKRVALRYFNVYGIGQPAESPYSGVITRFINSIARNRPLQIFGNGEQSRDFIHIRDLVEVNVRAASGELTPGAYNVCTGTGTSINTLVAHLKTHRPGIDVDYQPARPGEIKHSLGSTDQLSASLTRWTPMPFDIGMSRMLAEIDLSQAQA